MLNQAISGDDAIVHEALPFIGGAEKVLESIVRVLPGAPVFTLFYNRDRFRGTFFDKQEIRSSFIERVPGIFHNHYRYSPLFPLVIERFDLREYRTILSSHYAVAHGVRTTPGQLHISYTHTPLRYAWQSYQQFLADLPAPRALLARLVLHFFRIWDRRASDLVDHFLANSRWVASIIWRAYQRKAEVFYPPVDVDDFEPLLPREDYYITVSRLVKRKKVALIVDAFSQSGRPLLVVGAGDQHDALTGRAASNVQILGWQSKEKLAELLGRAKAFVHVAEDDFGIAAVEAQAAGCPVIAYEGGGTPETVVNGVTGITFPEQSPAGINSAVERFEEQAHFFKVKEIRRNAERFGRALFESRFSAMLEREKEIFQVQTGHRPTR